MLRKVVPPRLDCVKPQLVDIRFRRLQTSPLYHPVQLGVVC